MCPPHTFSSYHLKGHYQAWKPRVSLQTRGALKNPNHAAQPVTSLGRLRIGLQNPNQGKNMASWHIIFTSGEQVTLLLYTLEQDPIKWKWAFSFSQIPGIWPRTPLFYQNARLFLTSWYSPLFKDILYGPLVILMLCI